MTHEWVAVPETHTVQQALGDLRSRGELPPQTDRLFVVDARNVLRGSVTLPDAAADGSVGADRRVDGDRRRRRLAPLDQVQQAASAFERYDLVSAPVIDDRGKLVGRLTVDAVMDFVRSQADLRALKQAGLTRDEDLFASPMDSAFNRWPWLGINLVTAFLASRVIGQFEHTIRDLSALAALMPIVASIGGNTGNQTMAIMIRALARRSGARLGRDEAAEQGAPRQPAQRIDLGSRRRPRRGRALCQLRARRGHDRGGGVEPRRRGRGRRGDSVRPALDRDAIRPTARACC